MQFEVERLKLNQVLDGVSDVVPSKTAIPVLSHLLFEIVQEEGQEKGVGRATISATDLDVSISSSVPVSMLESGRFTVPARKFIEIVRELPEGMLSFDVKENRVTLVQQDQGRYVLMGLPPEDYPEIP